MPPLYLVDAYNVLHAVVLKGRERANWWGPENQARVVAAIAALGAGRQGFEAWVVFDRRGSELDELPAQPASPALPPLPASVSAAAPVGAGPGVEVHSAPDADDYIVARCAELSSTREVCVVSADRALCDRARRHGAGRLSPWAFAEGAEMDGRRGGAPGATSAADKARG